MTRALLAAAAVVLLVLFTVGVACAVVALVKHDADSRARGDVGVLRQEIIEAADDISRNHRGRR